MGKIVGKYELTDDLGSGTFAQVKRGIHVDTKEVCAVKIIDRQKLHQNQMEDQLKREIATMKLLKHENVVQLKEVMVSPNRIYLVMEIVEGGELNAKLKAEGGFDEDEARRYFQQLIVGLAYCHNQGIAHRDLKPQNLLLDSQDNIKIADFGLANVQDANSGTLLMTACGSPQYVAPEVLNETGYNGHLADVWSCGVILFYLVNGTVPFDDKNQNMLFMKIQSCNYRMPSSFSDDLKDLIKKILVVKPSDRLTLAGIMTHPWFVVDFDVEASQKSLAQITNVSDENLRNALTNAEE